MGSAGAQARGNGWYYPGEQGGDSGVQVYVTNLFFFFFFLTVSMNLKVSVCETDLTKENSVSALVLEWIGMSFIPEKVILKQYLQVLLNTGSRGS